MLIKLLLVKKRRKRRMVLLKMSMIKKVVKNLSILKRNQTTKAAEKRNPDLHPDLQVNHQTSLGDGAGKMMWTMMTVIDNQINKGKG